MTLKREQRCLDSYRQRQILISQSDYEISGNCGKKYFNCSVHESMSLSERLKVFFYVKTRTNMNLKG